MTPQEEIAGLKAELAEAKKCRLCGDTDVVCAKGAQEEIASLKARVVQLEGALRYAYEAHQYGGYDWLERAKKALTSHPPISSIQKAEKALETYANSWLLEASMHDRQKHQMDYDACLAARDAHDALRKEGFIQ